jgi:DNA (cytosine-5)-methyltransferase 1
MGAQGTNKLQVVELFAGVGGFRLGLEGPPPGFKQYRRKENRPNHFDYFETVWFNQWEPSTKRQHAHEIYVRRFGDIDENTCADISLVEDKVPDHDLLVGGFPCQDYSVAKPLSTSQGLVGSKGILWWSIFNILNIRPFEKRPQYLMLENVDRLLSSPAYQRGRDFAIILSSLNSLGYSVEWRVINAADYGMPQKRKRVFILGYKKGTPIEKNFAKYEGHAREWIRSKGVIGDQFKCITEKESAEIMLPHELHKVSNEFNTKNPKHSPFYNAGVCSEHTAKSFKVTADPKNSKKRTLGDVLEKGPVDEHFIIPNEEERKWSDLKDSKNEDRTAANGFQYKYSEGAMAFPDPLDKPSRTIVTGEGGASPSRFKHVVETEQGKRRLTPEELEKLCGFPPGFTEGVTDTKRAFLMGNALVVGVIEGLGKGLKKHHFDKRK